MKFVLAKSHSYPWPVTVRVPDPDQPGKLVEQQFAMHFCPRDPDAEREALNRIAAITDPAEQIRADSENLADVCTGWNDDVVDDRGRPVPFSRDALMQALNTPWFKAAVWKAYWESLSGQEARLGN